ncbi:DUF5007 domain-containing protein [Compostibacter hankyongensis]|uniref:DUF5007 domain-containing protein n=1 Tax=Compostibacter hankyongensis TaxID=1007089 RepID=A0ABP8G8N8_9BACT
MPGKIKYLLSAIVFSGILITSCRKWLPGDLDYLSPQAVFTQTQYQPILGRTTLYSRVFNTDNSTTPIHFEITNVRYKENGNPTDDLAREVPALTWKAAYTGYEKSLAEIEAKRTMEPHPLWEIREKSGDFILWSSADSTMLRQQPDSGYLFDVVASNSGGANTYKDLLLMPLRAQPYSPYEYDEITGERAKQYLTEDSSVYRLIYLHPNIYNITGDSTDLLLKSDSVRVYFHKKGNGSSLTFKFLNKDSLPISPSNFNRTIWDSVVHGFNVKITKDAVSYDVAYPIPLVRYPTRFTTTDGSQAHVVFTFDRLGFGGIRQTGTIDFSFSIFQKGDWEIIFHFYSDNPRFSDE